MKMKIAEMLGVEQSRVHVQFAGLNHMVFGLDVFLDGVSIKEKVLKEMGNPENAMTMKNIAGVAWDSDFLQALNAVPCGYHRYYYKTDEMLAEEIRASQEEGTRAEVVKELEKDLFELYKDENLSIKPPQLEKRGGAYYSDAACSLIHSIYTDKGDIQPVNTRNNGAIASIPYDSAVEVNCVITKDGPKPIAVGDLPVHVRGLVSSIKSFEITAAEAAVSGDYKKALLAMTINPLVPSDTIAKKILDEMLEAHRENLPQFFDSVEA
jgi:6-phospho-beta-glucosidase